MNEIKKFVLYSCVCAIFFAVIIFTPLSGVIADTLANQLKSALSSEPENTDFGKTLLLLSGLSGLNISSEYFPSVIYTVSADDYYDSDDTDIASMPDISDSPPNTRLFHNESIMSIQELYEYYINHGTVRIEEAEANINEIPAGVFRITPRNFSGQNTVPPRLLINNETSYNIANANIGDFLNRPFPVEPFDINRQDEPIILIVHTHATESFVDAGTFYYYPPFTAERTTDTDRNVVLIGRALKETLREYNIPVIQSVRIHDEPSFRDSYRRALETIEEYIARYPSIRYVIDVHRDSIIAPNGEKFRPAVKINGADTAQIMIVTGTDNGGAYHPNWRDNLTFSVHLQQKMNNRYPMLARPINLRAARFNQHATRGSIILEVGSCGSAFDEALRAARLFGECLAELILANN